MNFKFQQLSSFLDNNDGMLLVSEINRKWLLDFHSSFGFVLINKKSECIFITDSRYYLAAQNNIKLNNVQVWTIDTNNGLIDLLKTAKETLQLNRILIEQEYVTLDDFKLINLVFDQCTLFNSRAMREIKNEDEIVLLQKSADITVNTMEWIKTVIKPGYSELDIAKMISIKMLELGADRNSFDPIVAAGLNGANPHHQPSNYIISDGDFVTIDIGCMYKGFASDMTRTFVVGKEAKNKEMIDIYNLVLKSQCEGVKAARTNINGKNLDLVCRKIIDDSCYRGLFGHGTGHGVGLEVHELPNVNKTNEKKFVINNVITIEPGIYKPNVGGVRIEDTIVIKEGECLVLTSKSPKELVYANN